MESDALATTDGVAIGDDTLGGAFNRSLRQPLLDREQEVRLARRAARGEVAARDRLVEGSARLVVVIARGYRGRGVPHADLVQEGMMGLLQAVERFDPERGHRLAAYAAWWIRRAMLRAIGAAPTIRLPAQANRELAAILRTEHELSGHGRPRPDSAALAERTGVPLRRVERLRRAPYVVTSLDVEVAYSETPLIELVADPAVAGFASGIEDQVARDVLHDAVAALPPRTRRVIELRYGLAGHDPHSHDQIGQDLGLSAERCRQIEADGLRRLRALAERGSLRTCG